MKHEARYRVEVLHTPVLVMSVKSGRAIKF
jgi:hypothetical protein